MRAIENIDNVKIIVLVDNKRAPGLTAEHGFSLWVEVEGWRILFDTGQGKTLMNNARRMGVPLEKTDIIVISHGHFDHTGGIAEVLRVAPKARVILHQGAVIQRYSVRHGKSPREIGMPATAREAVERAGDKRIRWTLQPLNLDGALGITGPIPRETGYEDAGGPFFLDSRGKRKDAIEDDQALWISTPEGLIVCVGCCHAGLINTLNYARQVSGVSKIRAVIGGFHLLHADNRRLEMTVVALRSLDPETLVPCHCSGGKAVRALKAAFGARLSLCRAGLKYLSASGAMREKE